MTAAIMGLGIMTICSAVPMKVSAANDTITLRVCNWEEYIDEGGWDEDERIELPSGDIFGDRSLVEEFEDWYYENYGVRVKVEYSTFGTNEELYSQLNLGNVFDLVCPSDYMIMKLMTENRLEPLSDDFFDETNDNNYYRKGLSPYIKQVFDEHEINGEPWSDYAAGYMWGVTGMIYNPDEVTQEEASTWSILINEKFRIDPKQSKQQILIIKIPRTSQRTPGNIPHCINSIFFQFSGITFSYSPEIRKRPVIP